jgi:hypothetical protein
MFCCSLLRLGQGSDPRRRNRRARARQLGELGEHVVEEEGQPDALAASLVSHPVHAVIPVAAAYERQAVFAEPQSPLDRADAVFVERGRLLRAIRQVIVGLLVRLDRPALEEGTLSSSTPVSATQAT